MPVLSLVFEYPLLALVFAVAVVFIVQSVKRLAILGESFGQEFQRHVAVELGVFGLVHHTHAALAEFFKNAIMGNGLTDHSIRLLLW